MTCARRRHPILDRAGLTSKGSTRDQNGDAALAESTQGRAGDLATLIFLIRVARAYSAIWRIAASTGRIVRHVTRASGFPVQEAPLMPDLPASYQRVPSSTHEISDGAWAMSWGRKCIRRLPPVPREIRTTSPGQYRDNARYRYAPDADRTRGCRGIHGRRCHPPHAPVADVRHGRTCGG